MSGRLRPFFSYFGAKWTLAPKYPAPRYGAIIEWYAGSAQYALLHYAHDVVLIEAYAPVAELWRYLISATEAEILALPDLPEGKTVRDLGLAPGPSYLIGYWVQTATGTPRQVLTARNRAAAESKLYWGKRVRERVAYQLPAIRHWSVFECRAEEFEPESVECTHFVDAPYVKAGRTYGVHDVDYPALADRCIRARGQVIVCEAEGADWLPFRPFAETAARTEKGKGRTSREVVWTK